MSSDEFTTLDTPPSTYSSLLELPPELRLQIFQHLFAGETVKANAPHYPVSEHVTAQGHTALQPPSPVLNILYTCRAIHAEAIPVFYTQVRFHFPRQSTNGIVSLPSDIKATFPDYRPLSSSTNTSPIESTRHLVQHILYAGTSPSTLRTISTLFPALQSLHIDLHYDHTGIDQTNFDRAMKYALRNREWRHAIKDALEQRFPAGMVGVIRELQRLGKAQRGFEVVLHWRLGYRFLEFAGVCDLDEWVLRIRDAEGGSKRVYEVRQEPLFVEMG